MKKNYLTIVAGAAIISAIGVFIIDYFSHLLFSNPMETGPYFVAKAAVYFIFSLVFLSVINLEKNEFIKVAVGGIIVASLWGMYYNIFPLLFNYYPFGISLSGLTFLGTGLFGTGLAFGIVHTLAFVGGYYSSKFIFNFFENFKVKRAS
ncbi:MAG: hypothetical protein WCX17_02195 [Parcubacteria group bacterium]|jgi:hypothetical protein